MEFRIVRKIKLTNSSLPPPSHLVIEKKIAVFNARCNLMLNEGLLYIIIFVPYYFQVARFDLLLAGKFVGVPGLHKFYKTAQHKLQLYNCSAAVGIVELTFNNTERFLKKYTTFLTWIYFVLRTGSKVISMQKKHYVAVTNNQ